MSRSLVLLLSLAMGCGAAATQETPTTMPAPSATTTTVTTTTTTTTSTTTPEAMPIWDADAMLALASSHATPGPRRVLDSARAMLSEGTIVRGSCFDWVEAVYTRATGPSHDVFHSGHEHGPYADASVFQPGDWVFFINHSFGNDTHSAIFVAWADETQRVAFMVSYAGGRREEPGHYGEYVLDNAYRIVRMEDEIPPPHHHVVARR